MFSVRNELHFCVRTSSLKGLCTWNYVFTGLSQRSGSLRRLGLMVLMSERWGSIPTSGHECVQVSSLFVQFGAAKALAIPK